MDSAGLESAGLYVLAAPSPPSQILIDAGPQGGQGAGHGHADALGICLQSQGHSLLIDPGTFEYVGEGPQRDLFRATAMHNTLSVDGVSQSQPAGPFAWKHLTNAKAEQWVTGKSFDLFVGSHDGYSRLPSPVHHRRWIVSLKSGLYLVRDVAQGEGEHRLDIAWHLGPEMQLRAEHLFEVKETSRGLAVLCAEGHGWSAEVRRGTSSPVYGRREPVTVLNFGIITDLPAEFVTLLVPLAEARGIPGKLIQIREEGATGVKAYLYSTPSQESSFFFAERGRPWNQGRVASDAEFVCWQKNRTGEDQLLIFCNGSYLEIDGQRVLRFTQTIADCEMRSSGGETEVHASEPDFSWS